MAKYDCKGCANAATPICQVCRYVEKPGGEITKPTMYLPLGETEEPFDAEKRKRAGISEARDLAVVIGAHALAGEPIPLRYVLRYNTLTAEGETRTPSTANAELSREESLTGGASPSPTEAEDSPRAAE
jgi:hypothetical protein